LRVGTCGSFELGVVVGITDVLFWRLSVWIVSAQVRPAAPFPIRPSSG
jgi:hypothetical protein